MTAHDAWIVVQGDVMRYKQLFPQEFESNPQKLAEHNAIR